MGSPKVKREYYQRHRLDILEKNRRRRAVYRNKDVWDKRSSHLRTRYGITHDDYEAILRSQGQACAICRSDTNKNGKSSFFDVDHDHKTGKVRGLLCRECNVLLGSLEKDPELLRAAMAYLAAHNAVVVLPPRPIQNVLPFPPQWDAK